MEEPKALELTTETEAPLDWLRVRPGFPLRFSSRVGVWGLLFGVGASLAPLFFGSSVPFGLTGILGGIGFLAGGLGISVASSLVLRETWGSKRVLKYGALAGVPFGLLAAANGAIWLWFMPWVMEHLVLGGRVATGAFGLGIILVVLFAAGLLKHVWGAQDSDPEFI